MDGDSALPRSGSPPGRPEVARPGMRPSGSPGGPSGGPGGGRPGGFRGGHVDPKLIEGPITRTLITFSLPLLGGNILQQLNVTANQFWVAHLLGTVDITAIGNANSVMMLMMGAIFG